MNKQVRIRELFDVSASLIRPWAEKCEYPWELLPQIAPAIRQLVEEGLEGYEEVQPGVWAAPGVKIARTATFEGLCILGAGTEVRPGAYIRGNVLVGEKCVLGNSSEFKNCILLDHVQAPHYNYVGDSILGNYAHTGAGTICSNLKSDGKPVVIHGDEDYVTGIRKIGAFLGDHADAGCSCVLNPGTILGRYTRVYPMTSVRGVIPGHCIVKSQADIVEIEER